MRESLRGTDALPEFDLTPSFCASRELTQQRAYFLILTLSGATVRLHRPGSCARGVSLAFGWGFTNKVVAWPLSFSSWVAQYARWGCLTNYAYWQQLVSPWVKIPLIRLRPYIPLLPPTTTQINQPIDTLVHRR